MRMELLVLIIGLMIATVLAIGVGDRIRLPYPVLMVILAAAAAFVPGFPEVQIDPELILPLFLPPLLFATALKTSWSLFRIRWRSILLLAVALVVVTTAAVAGAAWLLIPGIGLPAAVALGAMVAPPDPVAVESVSGRVRMPRQLTTVLQSEGLFNDAAAIVIFQAAIGAATAGKNLDAAVVGSFLLGAAGAVLVGLATGWIAKQLTIFITAPLGRSAVTLVVPFAVYLIADELHASGVVAVVVAALEIRRTSHPEAAEERVTSRAFWEVVELLVTGIAFGLVGLEIRQLIQDERTSVGGLLLPALLICVLMFVLRFGWLALLVLPARRRGKGEPPSGMRDVAVLTWCGMRGLATLALALSLPATLDDGSPFPGRSEIVVVSVVVLLGTLVLPGLTLPWLMKVLKMAEGPERVAQSERELAARAQKTALGALQASDLLDGVPKDRVRWVKGRLERLHTELAGSPDYDDDDTDRRNFREWAIAVQAVALDAAREEMIAARAEPGVDLEAADRVMRRLDLRTLLAPE
ncbi:MAG: sodium/proton antiporter, family [Micrococcaceae bacterium]|nr:sodium/proton antiporter, family [Micrococcaceae bacterium]